MIFNSVRFFNWRVGPEPPNRENLFQKVEQEDHWPKGSHLRQKAINSIIHVFSKLSTRGLKILTSNKQKVTILIFCNDLHGKLSAYNIPF